MVNSQAATRWGKPAPARTGVDVEVTPMSESKLTIEERHAADVTILELTGEMLLDDGGLAFRKRIHELMDRGLVKVVLDL